MQKATDREAANKARQAERALALLDASSRRFTSSEFEKIVAEKLVLNRSRTKALVRELIREGELAFTYEHGCSFIERSFLRPLRIARELTLVPMSGRYRPDSGEAVVRVLPGAAFGTGRHPTTRLALKGVCEAWKERSRLPVYGERRVLDIGTGSGVLLIAALKLGASWGLGVDTDSCACAEARENLSINGLKERAEIDRRQACEADGRFSLICANLRYPTLVRLAPVIGKMLHAEGRVVISGIKTGEADDVQTAYQRSGMIGSWRQSEKGWEGMVLKKEAGHRL